MKFILTADDYGHSPIIDDAIEEAAERGMITSVAAFPNVLNRKTNEQNNVEKVREFQDRFPHISIGLHFSVTAGPRVNKGSKSLSLEGSDLFKPVTKQLKKVSEDELKDELRAQIRLFEDAGIQIKHFSDHHGILNHTRRGRDALIEVITEYNNRVGKQVSIRNPVFTSSLINSPSNCLDKSNAIGTANLFSTLDDVKRFLFMWNRKERRRVKFLKGLHKPQKDLLDRFIKAGIPSTDYFVDSMWSAINKSVTNCIFNPKNYSVETSIEPAFRMIPDEPTVEFMLHFAKTEDDYDADFYQKELDYLDSLGGIDTTYITKKSGRRNEFRLIKNFVKDFEKHKQFGIDAGRDFIPFEPKDIPQVIA